MIFFLIYFFWTSIWVCFCDSSSLLWWFWRQSICVLLEWGKKNQLGAYCCLKKLTYLWWYLFCSLTQMHTDTHTHTQTQMPRVMKWWRWGERRVSKRNEERIAFTQYSLGRERESARERLLRDRAVKGGGGGWARRVETEWLEWVFLQRRSGGSDISREAQHPCGREKANGEKRGFLGFERVLLAEKQEGMGQNQSRRASQGWWLQGWMDNKGPAWTEIALESGTITHTPSSHHLCPSLCLSPHAAHICPFYSVLQLHSPIPKLHLLSGCNDARVCDSRATCRLLISTCWRGPGTVSAAVYTQPKGQCARRGTRGTATSARTLPLAAIASTYILPPFSQTWPNQSAN